MKYIKLLSLFLITHVTNINAMDRLLTKRYEKKPRNHRSSKIVLVPSKSESQVKEIVLHKKDLVCYLHQGTFYPTFTEEIDKNILRFIGTNTGGDVLRESAQIFSALICVNKFTYMHMNDDQRTLGWIKDLSKRFDCTNLDVARVLCTRAGKNRYDVQLGLILFGWEINSSMRENANKLKKLGLDTNFSYEAWYPSPLFECCYNNPLGSLMAAQWLLENGADPNICLPGDNKNAVMVFLARNNNTAMLVLPNSGIVGIKQSLTTSLLYSLISHPALKLNHQDSHQNTLLHYCLLNYVSAIIATIRQLIERGANPTIKNKDGKKPLDLAKETNGKDVKDVIELLEQAEIGYQNNHQRNENLDGNDK